MGYGDDIMATAEAKEAKKLFPDANILIGDGRFNYPSIMYLNNRYNLRWGLMIRWVSEPRRCVP